MNLKISIEILAYQYFLYKFKGKAIERRLLSIESLSVLKENQLKVDSNELKK